MVSASINSNPSVPSSGASRRTIPHLSLLVMVVCEIVLFSITGNNFWTLTNALEVMRLSVEIGLLTLGLTLVIVSGGIDLSVGSLMGLTAVCFGWLWRDMHVPLVLAGLLALIVGLAAGALNGWFIARLRVPPLIVTLGTFSLFRGLAEGMTGGVENYTGWPAAYLFLGQGYVLGLMPTQLPILVLVAALTAWWLHRAAFGRGLSAIGFSIDGARYAGIAVDRRLISVYALSGILASLAALVYVAHLGQAKADAGTGYELMAITAVVLGGTSIFGGHGSVAGSMLGLLAIAILQNGLRLSDMPAELAGIMSGLLLLVTITLDGLRLRGRPSAQPDSSSTLGTHSPTQPHSTSEEMDMKNSQLALLCATILVAAAIIAGSNRSVVEAIKNSALAQPSNRLATPEANAPNATDQAGTNPSLGSGGGSTGSGQSAKRITVAMMPKSKGNAYFIACRKGAEQAAKELNVNLLWDGPTDPDPAKQNEVIDTWITRGVDVLAVAVENRAGISSVLRKARERGIRVVTWDSDAEVDARDFFVNQATPEGIGTTLMDQAAKSLGGKGKFAIITASLTAANMIEWQKHIEARRASKYPEIEMAVLRPCDDKQPKAFDEANNILNAYPDVKLIMGICSPSVPGAAEAVKQSGRTDVKVIGLGLPNDSKRFVHDGITDAVILWNTMDLGYLTVHAASQLHAGVLTNDSSKMVGGKLGELQIVDRNILLGQPFVFTKANIDQFDF